MCDNVYMNRTDVHLIINKGLKNTIKALASLEGLSLSAFIEKILYDYLNKEKEKNGRVSSNRSNK